MSRTTVMNTCKNIANNFAKQATRNYSVTNINLQEKGFFSQLFVHKVAPTTDSHSKMLGKKEQLYEIVTHNVKADSVSSYSGLQEKFVKKLKEREEDLEYELMGSFGVSIGDQDQFIHLWRYNGGYASIDRVLEVRRKDPEIMKLTKEMSPMLRSRHTQLSLAFQFWPEVKKREGSNIYEMRSYHLRPGTLIEWSTYWAKAIHMREHNQNQEAFCGLFSQIGELYNVKYIWCYNHMADRKQAREEAWHHPGWNETVANTVPLIRQMTSRIMTPLSFSPTK